MALNGVRLLLAALLLVVLVHNGSCVKCYTCSGAEDKLCNDPFSKTIVHAEDCTKSQLCTKHKQPAATVDVVGENKKDLTQNIIRGCKEATYCEEVKGFSEHCSHCTTDFCNSSAALVPSFLGIALYLAKSFLY